MTNERGGAPMWLVALVGLGSAIVGGGVVAGADRMIGGGSGGGDAIRDYLYANPEVLPEAMDRLRTRETAKIVDANADKLTKPFDGAWAGNPQGDVTVVAFMDYACGYCRASLPAVERLLTEDKGVRIVYRELPILSDTSRAAAGWSLAAAEQGKFKAFHNRLFAAGQLSPATLEATIAATGLDRARAESVMASQRIDREIAGNLDLIRDLGANGTPTWVIGNQVINGAVPYEAMKAAVDKARQKS